MRAVWIEGQIYKRLDYIINHDILDLKVWLGFWTRFFTLINTAIASIYFNDN